jgi:hypothetical protein
VRRPAGPIFSISRRSIAMWMSSSEGEKTNSPAAISFSISARPRIFLPSAAGMIWHATNMWQCAIEPAMSYGAKRLSTWIDEVNSSTIGAVAAANRPSQGFDFLFAMSALALLHGALGNERLDAEAERGEADEAFGVGLVVDAARLEAGDRRIVERARRH